MPAGRGAVQLARQHDVLGGRQRRDQVQALEDVADRSPTQLREREPGQPAQAHSLDDDVTGCGGVEPAREVQQRRLAGARRPHDRDELAGLHSEVDTVERADRRLVVAVRRGRRRGTPAPGSRSSPRPCWSGRAVGPAGPVGFVGLAACRPAHGARHSHQPGLAVVQPADLGLGAEDERVGDQQPRQLITGGLARAGVVLQRPHGGRALRLDDGPDVDAGTCARPGRA